MANYLIKESTLKSIANDVRTMQGSTASMTASEMATQLGAVKNGVGNKIDTQTDLISQIKSALEGKAAGGGGSSGGEIETRTLNITADMSGASINTIAYTGLDEEGKICSKVCHSITTPYQITDLVNNSIFYITTNFSIIGRTFTNCDAIAHTTSTFVLTTSNSDSNELISEVKFMVD